jgi:hypothetical protein
VRRECTGYAGCGGHAPCRTDFPRAGWGSFSTFSLAFVFFEQGLGAGGSGLGRAVGSRQRERKAEGGRWSALDRDSRILTDCPTLLLTTGDGLCWSGLRRFRMSKKAPSVLYGCSIAEGGSGFKGRNLPRAAAANEHGWASQQWHPACCRHFAPLLQLAMLTGPRRY